MANGIEQRSATRTIYDRNGNRLFFGAAGGSCVAAIQCDKAFVADVFCRRLLVIFIYAEGNDGTQPWRQADEFGEPVGRRG